MRGSCAPNLAETAHICRSRRQFYGALPKMNRKDRKERKDPKRCLVISSYFEVFVVFEVQAFEVSRH